MADLVTKLLLETKQFDANLGKSTLEIKQFQQKIEGFGKNAVGAFTKFAGAIGIAYSGMEAFNKVMSSSQTTSDFFVKTQLQATTAVDAFFTSLSMGDVSGFLSNIDELIKSAGILADVLDELETKNLFTNSEVFELQSQHRI
jgi:hypothetical protein